ncbi:hypothetical protein AB6813_16855 [bacterium RCC_150]
MFRRTLLYAGPPYTSLWYDVASPAETVGARAIIYLRRRPMCAQANSGEP